MPGIFDFDEGAHFKVWAPVSLPPQTLGELSPQRTQIPYVRNTSEYPFRARRRGNSKNIFVLKWCIGE